MNIPPGTKAECLSISFSPRWFNNNVAETTDHILNLKEKMSISGYLSLVGSMTESERKTISQLMRASGKNVPGSFYVKCTVYKIISDFFLKLKERQFSA